MPQEKFIRIHICIGVMSIECSLRKTGNGVRGKQMVREVLCEVASIPNFSATPRGRDF